MPSGASVGCCAKTSDVTLAVPGVGFGFAGGGFRLDRVQPVGRIGEFHVRPGFTMGAAHPPICDPGCPHAEGVGRAWSIDLDVAIGVRVGVWFFSVGGTLGVAAVRGLEPSPFQLNGGNDPDQTVVHPVISAATVDLGWVPSRRYPIRLGMRGMLFVTVGESAYLSFPLHAPFQRLGQISSEPNGTGRSER